MKEWIVRQPRVYHAAGAGAAAILLVATLGVLWIAGAFGGGDEAPAAIQCVEQDEASDECPSPTPRRSPARKRTPTATTTVTPTPALSPTKTTAPGVPIFTPRQTPPPAPTAPPPPPHNPSFGLALDVGSANIELMVDLAMIPGGSDEAVVLSQKSARLWRVSLSDAFPRTLYGDLSDRVGGNGGEEGLLSATFSPNFQSDSRIYVYYTQGGESNLPTVLSRFQVVNGVMDTANETRILEIPDFASNHNGGRILFGPDGYLYLSTGDGGGGGDPNENGQDPNSLLGKVLRLKVTDEPTYSIPPDNPFVSGPGRDEIWAYGFRNPWRFSFDRATGAMWLGDVGQGSWEEVDQVVKGGNYGWDCYEGNAAYEAAGCPLEGFEFPRAVYATHEAGSCAITGGYVYRGQAIPQLRGWYIYGDFCSGRIWAVNTATPGSEPNLLLDSNVSIASFAELPNGELVILTFDYAIYRLVYA